MLFFEKRSNQKEKLESVPIGHISYSRTSASVRYLPEVHMRFSYIKPVIIIAIFVFGVVSPVLASSPEQIDVRTLSASYSANSSDAYFQISAQRQNGLQISYGGPGNLRLMQLSSCYPCQMPSTFDSNGFQSGFQFRWGPDRVAYFYADYSVSDTIGVSPRENTKLRSIEVAGRTTIHGRLEIRDQNTTIAVDNDVTLIGQYRSLFWPTALTSARRAIQFVRIEYLLTQPTN